MVTVRKIRLHNPQQKSAPKRTSPARRANPTSLVTLGFVNPERKPMKRKKNTQARPKRTVIVRRKATPARKRNPVTTVVRTKHRKRNPQMVSQTKAALTNGLAALVGLFAARQLPQAALGARNTGWMGYAATVATILLSHIAARQAAGSAIANAVAIGGGMQLCTRLLNEYVSPVGKILSLSGVGDATAAGLGEIKEMYFPLPVPTQPGTLTPILPAALQPPAPAQAAAASAAPTMSGVNRSRSRFASRF